MSSCGIAGGNITGKITAGKVYLNTDAHNATGSGSVRLEKLLSKEVRRTSGTQLRAHASIFLPISPLLKSYRMMLHTELIACIHRLAGDAKPSCLN